MTEFSWKLTIKIFEPTVSYTTFMRNVTISRPFRVQTGHLSRLESEFSALNVHLEDFKRIGRGHFQSSVGSECCSRQLAAPAQAVNVEKLYTITAMISWTGILLVRAFRSPVVTPLFR